MLQMAFNVSWKEHMTNEMLYGNLPQLTSKIQQRRLKLVGHFWGHKEEIESRLVQWKPLEGTRNRGRQCISFIDNLLQDTGMANTQELWTLMEDRREWRRLVAHVGCPGNLLTMKLK